MPWLVNRVPGHPASHAAVPQPGACLAPSAVICGGRRFLVNQRGHSLAGVLVGVSMLGVLAWCWGLGLWGAVAALDEHEARQWQEGIFQESVAVVELVARLEGDALRGRLAPPDEGRQERLDALVRAWRRLSASPLGESRWWPPGVTSRQFQWHEAPGAVRLCWSPDALPGQPATRPASWGRGPRLTDQPRCHTWR